MELINVEIWLPAAAFLALILLWTGLRQYAQQHSKRKQLIDKIRFGDIFSDENAHHQTNKKIKTHPVLKFLDQIGNRIHSPQYDSQTKTLFHKAGIRHDKARTIFWGTKCVLASGLPIVFLMIRITFLSMLNLRIVILFSVLLALLGFYLPDFVLKIKTEKRKEKIFDGLPDALDLLVVCVEAGMGLDSAIFRVAEETELSCQVLSQELKLVNLELRAGKSRADALRDFAIRTDIEDVHNLVTLLIQSDKFGTSVARSLRVFSDSFRSQRAQKAEEIAAKLPVKMLFPMLLFIFPSLFVVIIGPGAIRIYHALISH